MNYPHDVAHFYFEAQTGIIRDKPPAFSNFHQYRLRRVHLDRVQTIMNAHDPSNYPSEFLEWLAKHDEPRSYLPVDSPCPVCDEAELHRDGCPEIG